MKFKTLRTSKTGKKLAEISKKRQEARSAVLDLGEKWGFTKHRPDAFEVWGGVSAIVFDKEPDMKLWKKAGHNENEYMPRLNNKEGKKLGAILHGLPTVSSFDLNKCVGYNGAPISTIGFNSNNIKYYLFSVGDNWDFTPPKDCKEITVSEYKKLGV